MGLYIYQSHLGGLYTSEEELDWKCLYCDTCGDSDWLLGYAENREIARVMLKEQDLYTDKYIKKFLDKKFPEGGDS